MRPRASLEIYTVGCFVPYFFIGNLSDYITIRRQHEKRLLIAGRYFGG
jgi:hypothetical protein